MVVEGAMEEEFRDAAEEGLGGIMEKKVCGFFKSGIYGSDAFAMPTGLALGMVIRHGHSPLFCQSCLFKVFIFKPPQHSLPGNAPSQYQPRHIQVQVLTCHRP